MSLVVLQLLWPLAAIVALQHIISNTNDPDTWKKLKRAGIATAGVVVIMFMAYLSLDYLDEGAKQLKLQVAGQQAQVSEPVLNAINAITEDRKAIFLQDIFKALAISGVFSGSFSLYKKKNQERNMGGRCSYSFIVD